MSLLVKNGDGTPVNLKSLTLQDLTELVIKGVISYAHLMTHLGYRFQYDNYSDMLSGADLYIALEAPASGNPAAHLTYSFSGNDGSISVQFIKNPDSYNVVETLTAVNKNHNSANAPNMALKIVDTVVVGAGSIIEKHKVGASNKVGGEAAEDEETILQNGVNYLLHLHNESAQANSVDWYVYWYEDILGLWSII